jgi:hypothetical protein
MNSMPMIVRCTLGQGGGQGYIAELNEAASHARRIFGPDSIVAAARIPPVEPEPPVTHSTLAAWALNLSAVKELAEPTRGEL